MLDPRDELLQYAELIPEGRWVCDRVLLEEPGKQRLLEEFRPQVLVLGIVWLAEELQILAAEPVELTARILT